MKCKAWADGQHCFEVSGNRGSKHCACGAAVKLSDPNAAIASECLKCGCFSNWVYADGQCPWGEHKKVTK